MGSSNTSLAELKAKLLLAIKGIEFLIHRQSPEAKSKAREVEAILISSLQNGLNITQSCLQAGISRETFYARRKEDPVFSDRMAKAEQFATMKARQNVVKAINNGDLNTSKWHLERKDPEYKPKSDITSDDKPLQTALVEFVGDDGTTNQNKD